MPQPRLSAKDRKKLRQFRKHSHVHRKQFDDAHGNAYSPAAAAEQAAADRAHDRGFYDALQESKRKFLSKKKKKALEAKAVRDAGE